MGCTTCLFVKTSYVGGSCKKTSEEQVLVVGTK
jgi:hypothetical protein